MSNNNFSRDDLNGFDHEPMELTLMCEAEDKAHGRRLRAAMGLLSVEDLALLLGLTLGTAKAWQKQGLGPTPIKIGQKISLYDVDTVKTWILSHTKEVADLNTEESERF